MKVITRQFTKEILLATSFVLMALVALFAFFELINQLEDVGKDYTIGTAFLLTALTLPARIYEVMPLAVLLVLVKRGLRRGVHSRRRRKSIRKLARDDPAHARVHLLLYRPPSGDRVYHLLRAVEVKAARRRLKVSHAVL